MTSRRHRPPGRAHRPAAAVLTLAVLTLASTACLGILGGGAGAVTPRGLADNPSARLVATSPPTVIASPTTASAPDAVTLSVANFDPTGSSVTCHFTSGSPATSRRLRVAHTGAASGTIPLTPTDAVGTNPIVCTQTSHTDAVLTASAAFAVTTVEPTCSVSTTPPTCGVGQVVGTRVNGTDLTLDEVLNSTPNATGGVNPTSQNVAFSKVTLGNQATDPACRTPHATGICSTDGFVAANAHLNTVVVDNDLGDLAGWDVTGQMTSDFEGPTVGRDHTIPADYLTWVPRVSPESTHSCVSLGPTTAPVQACGPSDVASEVSAGPIQTLSTSRPAVLCQAAPGGGGGGTKCTAELVLAVPPYVVAGRYTATIDIVVS